MGGALQAAFGYERFQRKLDTFGIVCPIHNNSVSALGLSAMVYFHPPVVSDPHG